MADFICLLCLYFLFCFACCPAQKIGKHDMDPKIKMYAEKCFNFILIAISFRSTKNIKR